MLAFDTLATVSVAYVAGLFAVAFWAERRAGRGRESWLRSPLIYTLSLSVYCTAWTFYGAVGYAARSGLEYLTVYLGPTLVFIGWWWLLRKLVRIGRTQRITSIADLISSRFGKSNALAVIVTLGAVVGTTPYIALQLQSVTLSFAVFAGSGDSAWGRTELISAAFWVAAGLALFTVLFGTRNLDANGRHHGVVMAIAVEAVVKLFALVAVGVFVVWGVAGGIAPMFERIEASPISEITVTGGRWAGLMFLSAAAIICLPRMFQVIVVENSDERHLNTASWAFPLYLLLMSLFVVPIAVMGLELMPAGSNPDLFVLTLPLGQGREALAMAVFLGGFSSATSMVIVAAIALSTMLSNHVVMPIWLAARRGRAMMSGDVRNAAIAARRASIAGILALGYLYYRYSGGGEALAKIGLISFAGVVQVLPALLGGIFWRGATRRGAAAGLLVGFAVWAYTLFLPSFGEDVALSRTVFDSGLLGLGVLRPHALFGIEGFDPLVHSLIWSMLLNTGLFILLSLRDFPSPLERLQGAQIVNVFNHGARPGAWVGGHADTEDLLVMAQRILGPREARDLFEEAAGKQGKRGGLPDPTPEFMEALERELAGSVGAATAHAMVGQIAGRASVSVGDLLAVADETAQILEYSGQLEAKSRELASAAVQLREANEKLTEVSIQKDAFLNQISHELRTPMTSIRSFSEILRDGDMADADRARFAGIIHDESIRLTRLLDDLLDINVLENGRVALHMERVDLRDVIDRAVASAAADAHGLTILRDREAEEIALSTDGDRLVQVFVNLITNARKYCGVEKAQLEIRATRRVNTVAVDFVDNGKGIPAGSRTVIFEKFARLSDENPAGSVGLGLAICREIMARLGGSISCLPGDGGAAFRVILPLSGVDAPETG